MTSFAYYQAGAYDDCVTAAQRYITLHPGSADAAYAQYLIGASNFDATSLSASYTCTSRISVAAIRVSGASSRT